MAAIKLAPVARRTRQDTIELTHAVVNDEWKLPPFQRRLRVNEKLRNIAEDIRLTGVMPGTLTIGVIDDGPAQGRYLLDGQHRVEAFRLSDVQVAYADVKYIHFETLAQMGKAFVELNSSIVAMRPDDILRGMEDSLPVLGKIRVACPYVGYDQIRRGESHPVVSMSMVLRIWQGSAADTPVSYGASAMQLAQDLREESAAALIEVLQLCEAAWGRTDVVKRLWGALNLVMCMWLYRRCVLDQSRHSNSRHVTLNATQFLGALHALKQQPAEVYRDWLVGRGINDRDRPVCYTRLKAILVAHLHPVLKAAPKFPQPPWSTD